MSILKLGFVLLLLTSGSVFARGEGHIITASSTKSSLSFYKDGYNEVKSSFDATAAYDYSFAQGLMLGADFGTSIYSNSSFWSLAIGPGYNFNKQDIENSYFATAKIGAASSHYGSYSSTHALMTLKGGKRFKLMEHVSYVPGLSISKVFEIGSDPTLTFEILRIAIIF
jgi:hypothetical protein